MNDNYCRVSELFYWQEESMKQKTTELPKYRRIVEIYAFLIRNIGRQYTVAEVKKYLEEGGETELDISERLMFNVTSKAWQKLQTAA